MQSLIQLLITTYRNNFSSLLFSAVGTLGAYIGFILISNRISHNRKYVSLGLYLLCISVCLINITIDDVFRFEGGETILQFATVISLFLAGPALYLSLGNESCSDNRSHFDKRFILPLFIVTCLLIIKVLGLIALNLVYLLAVLFFICYLVMITRSIVYISDWRLRLFHGSELDQWKTNYVLIVWASIMAIGLAFCFASKSISKLIICVSLCTLIISIWRRLVLKYTVKQ